MVAAEQAHFVLPPEDAVAADLLGQHPPAVFAQQLAFLAVRRPLVAVLALLPSTPAQRAAVAPADWARALALPTIHARWRTPLVLAASAPGALGRTPRRR